MKKQVLACLFLLGCCSVAMAQADKMADHKMAGDSMAGATTDGKIMDAYIAQVEGEFVPAADAMPEDKYSYSPTGGEFKGVRTFAQQVKHVAAVNYIIAGAILGEKPPVELGGENGPDAMTSKADIMKFLKDSFTYVHKAVPTLDEKSALGTVKNPFSDRQITRLELSAWVPGHAFDHYGQIVEYLRMNSIIPPASRQ